MILFNKAMAGDGISGDLALSFQQCFLIVVMNQTLCQLLGTSRQIRFGEFLAWQPRQASDSEVSEKHDTVLLGRGKYNEVESGQNN